MNKPTTFKRIEVGSNFFKDGTKYRKCNKNSAFRIKDTGIGETHAKLPFTRSCAVMLP